MNTRFDDMNVSFAPRLGGFLSEASLGKNIFLKHALPLLSVKLANGGIARPFLENDHLFSDRPTMRPRLTPSDF